MNQTSSVVTGGVTVTAATIIPFVNWGLTGFTAPPPETAPYLIAAALVTVIHLVSNLVNTYLKKNEPKPDVVVAVSPIIQPLVITQPKGEAP